MNARSARKRSAGLLLALLLALTLCAAPASSEGTGEAPLACVTADLAGELLQCGGFPASEPAAGAALLSDRGAAREAIVLGLRDRAESIDISAWSIPAGEAGTLFRDVINAHPELFFVGSSFSLSYDPSGIAFALFPSYDGSYDEADIAAFSQAAEDILRQLDPEWDELQKLLFLHDCLVTHCEYDLSLSRFNAYNALVEHSAVCQGYALSFSYLAKQAGIQSCVISSEEMKHAWNLLRLGEAWYYADCTWDDPTGQYPGYCSHENLLRSRAGLLMTGHTGDDWVAEGLPEGESGLPVGDAFEEAFWLPVCTAIPQLGDRMAFVRKDDRTNVFLYDYGSGETAGFPAPVPLAWPVWEKPGYVWTDNCSSFVARNGAFWFTSPENVLRLDPDGGMEVVYPLSGEERALGQLYGLTEEDGRLLCYLGTAPGGVGYSSFVLPLSSEPPAGPAECRMEGGGFRVRASFDPGSASPAQPVRAVCVLRCGGRQLAVRLAELTPQAPEALFTFGDLEYETAAVFLLDEDCVPLCREFRFGE